MDIRPLTDAYAVSPQIDPTDMPAIAAAGYRLVINNRPCDENPPSHHSSQMEQAARAAGLDYLALPVVHAALGPDLAAQQRSACDGASGPVLAYCASGTRSTIVWALGQAGHMPTEDIISAAAAQGYDLSMMRAHLDAVASA